MGITGLVAHTVDSPQGDGVADLPHIHELGHQGDVFMDRGIEVKFGIAAILEPTQEVVVLTGRLILEADLFAVLDLEAGEAADRVSVLIVEGNGPGSAGNRFSSVGHGDHHILSTHGTGNYRWVGVVAGDIWGINGVGLMLLIGFRVIRSSSCAAFIDVMDRQGVDRGRTDRPLVELHIVA